MDDNIGIKIRPFVNMNEDAFEGTSEEMMEEIYARFLQSHNEDQLSFSP